MCVIVYKPAHVKLNEDNLEDCYYANMDGCGFSYRNKKGDVSIVKGMFSFQELMEMYDSVGLTDDHDVVFHFRIATSGQVDGGTAHPFPVTDDLEAMQRRITRAPAAIAHNGVLANEWGYEDMDAASDTMLAIKYFIAPHANDEDALVSATAALAEISGNRFALMTPDFVETFGKWHEVDGSYYSNLNWQWKYKYGRYNGYKKYLTAGDDYYNFDGGRYCKNCGNPLTLGDVNCIYCGVPVVGGV